MSKQQHSFILGGVSTTGGIVLKGHTIRKAENHCPNSLYGST